MSIHVKCDEKYFNVVFSLYLYRELEDEYTVSAANVSRRASIRSEDMSDATKCPICDVTDLIGDKQNACVDCEQIVCLDCGCYEMSPKTKVSPLICIDNMGAGPNYFQLQACYLK